MPIEKIIKLSDVPVRTINASGKKVVGGSWDSLAYDHVSVRPSTGKRTETLLSERYTIAECSGPVKATNGELVRRYYTSSFRQTELVRKVDTMYRPATKQAYLEANSLDNILLPAAANMLCPKCGMTVSCTCDKPIKVTQEQYRQYEVSAGRDGIQVSRKPIHLKGFSSDPWSATAKLADRLISKIPSAIYWVVETEL